MERGGSPVPARVDRDASHVDGQAHLEAAGGVVIEALAEIAVSEGVVRRRQLRAERGRLAEQVEPVAAAERRDVARRDDELLAALATRSDVPS